MIQIREKYLKALESCKKLNKSNCFLLYWDRKLGMFAFLTDAFPSERIQKKNNRFRTRYILITETRHNAINKGLPAIEYPVFFYYNSII